MYVPKHFNQSDKTSLINFIADYSFGILTTSKGSEPTVSIIATHIPFLVEQDGKDIILIGHVARANPHWQLFADKNSTDAPESLVIFHGPHAYISPTWYETPGRVPTWNYTAVHAYGVAQIIEDKEELHQLVLELSDKFERDRDDPWIPDFDLGMLNAIVGFKIPVSRIEGKFKLSQDKPSADIAGAIKGLEQGGSENEIQTANLMSKLQA